MVIRDNVYGDIEISSKFVNLINTYEFQRLRRIKQLATAEQVFPGATHSRFAHSIGTYHVMTKIMSHFEKILGSIGQEQRIDEEERDIILAAALLHDIGHGPFSHAFEKAQISSKSNSHEEWTGRIISDESTEINHELRKWGDDTPKRVVEYINYRTEAKKSTENISYVDEGITPDLKFIFTSLVSSQLDADRMDYLLRDSFHCGVTFGKYDLDNLIAGMGIGINSEGKFRVCVKKSYLANVEEYFCSRYQMYRNIYYHPYKVLSETLLEKILNKACYYYLDGKLQASYIPPLIREIFEHADIALQDYLQLDDTVVMGAIHIWSHIEKDEMHDLRKLCEFFLNRTGYKQILLTDVDAFLQDLSELLENEGVDKWEEKQNLIFIKCVNSAKMYDKTSEKPVYILTCDGKVKNVESVSGLIGEERKEKTIYYSKEFCQYYLQDVMQEKVEKLLQDYDIRKAVEIEKKYILDSPEDAISNKIIEILEQKHYDVEDEGITNQVDEYYDTSDKLFDKNNYTLRIRKKGERYWLTLKTPSDSVSNSEAGQLERNEIEREVNSNTILDCKSIVEPYLGEFLSKNDVDYNDLNSNIRIVNSRRKITIVKNLKNEFVKEEKYEMVFDDVQYINKENGKTHQELQMEIELKSSVETRINMKSLTDELEKEIKEMKSISDSKYHRAIQFTI
ncbi:MAG: HD domain-containing protein [Lachnospiraceae bacterium]|nr:HD domain-containing protein [Lachnospiraceae bacterium]